jgi:hypothetical protein
MKVFVLKCAETIGDVFFKGYNTTVKDVEWTGVLERACFWLDKECAEIQATDLTINHGCGWIVVSKDISNT